MRFEGLYASFSPAFEPLTDCPLTDSQRYRDILLLPTLLFQLPRSFPSLFSPIGFLWCSHTSYSSTLYFPLPRSVDHPFKNKPVETEKDLLRLLANTVGWVYNPKLSPAYSCSTTLFSHDGETSSMGRVLTTLQRLKEGCLAVLTSRFARWTKPLRTSLPLATFTDLGRSRSQLIAENALLRQQLIVLRREVKRPAFTRTDRILLVLLAKLVRSWQQALLIVKPDTVWRLSSGALSLVLEAQVQGCFSYAQGRCRNDRLDQADGERESPSSVLSVFVENC